MTSPVPPPLLRSRRAATAARCGSIALPPAGGGTTHSTGRAPAKDQHRSNETRGIS